MGGGYRIRLMSQYQLEILDIRLDAAKEAAAYFGLSVEVADGSHEIFKRVTLDGLPDGTNQRVDAVDAYYKRFDVINERILRAQVLAEKVTSVLALAENVFAR